VRLDVLRHFASRLLTRVNRSGPRASILARNRQRRFSCLCTLPPHGSRPLAGATSTALGAKNASPGDLAQRFAPTRVRVPEVIAMLVSMTLLLVCLGAHAATVAGAQYSPPTLTEHHQWERQMMQDVSREMIEMTEQMARSDVTPEQRKNMTKRMEDLSSLMHGMSKIMHRMSSLHSEAMTDP